MANPEHVEIVKQGRAAVERWRYRNNWLRMDLSGADFRGADLRAGYLPDVDLRGANFMKADLIDADLGRSDLSGADLRHADLIDANLGDTSLQEADLSWADLRGAGLHQARFDMTVLSDTELADAKGLESIHHQGPSIIDERTLRKSWPLPPIFLRGVGLSDQYIQYLPSLMNQAIEFYSCFISYSSKDDAFAKRLHADLQDRGVRCWLASEDLKTGDPFRDVIDQSIRTYDKLLLILSRDSIQSPWVQSEVEAALERERKQKRRGLFPIRIDDSFRRTRKAWAADIRRTRHIGDFRRWKEHDAYEQAFERLLRDLKA